MISEHERLQAYLRDLPKPAAFPLMTRDHPDTHERTRLAVQSIPFALPEKKKDAADA